jgi:uncharacterized circularly permuted ATP-grasp superfamily protein
MGNPNGMEPLDEAFAAPGRPRRLYEPLIEALDGVSLEALRERARSEAAAIGLDFGEGEPMRVDPVPRLIGLEEWQALEAGLLQRARALNEFVLDVYGERRIVAAGVVPGHLIETSSGYEPAMNGLLDPEVPPASVFGFDLVRDGRGELLVLEDNARMPSGACYALALRGIVEPLLDTGLAPLPIDGYTAALGAAIRAASPAGDSTRAAILSEGPGSGAWFEHRALAEALDVRLVHPDELEPSGERLFARDGRERLPIDVLYRRLDDDRLTRADGSPTPLGELLLPALRGGALRCVNAFGTGVADDKLAHAYVPDMIRFYLGEAPLLRSPETLDLAASCSGEEAIERLEQLVVKPRDGFGGHGVTVMPRAEPSERRRAERAVRREPGRFVAQEPIPLSTHPTVCEGRLRGRHVDLRPYVVCGRGGELSAMRGGLTRYAAGDGDMVVNSSRGGGCKDTWVVDR